MDDGYVYVREEIVIHRRGIEAGLEIRLSWVMALHFVSLMFVFSGDAGLFFLQSISFDRGITTSGRPARLCVKTQTKMKFRGVFR